MEAEELDRSGNLFYDYSNAIRQLGRSAGREIRCERFPIVDQAVPTKELMLRILQSIREELAAGGIVYAHCWGGKGRTAVVVGCF